MRYIITLTCLQNTALPPVCGEHFPTRITGNIALFILRGNIFERSRQSHYISAFHRAVPLHHHTRLRLDKMHIRVRMYVYMYIYTCICIWRVLGRSVRDAHALGSACQTTLSPSFPLTFTWENILGGYWIRHWKSNVARPPARVTFLHKRTTDW